ncbi:metal ABC transporter permease [Halomonas sp. 328]|uniref:metal ABC transporter permease n=1 Tax=Halomonas sp. 328 TaxID=2776704 RepID=UPI0018A7C20F|nr:metal ABC transporter permease [Halomonas sp. 328]MBF8224148.1 metal ABC transporter permease [Halomonas sp. 328]
MLDFLLGWLIAPFDYAFMRRALAACVVLALTMPVIGVLLTLRGMSLMGEALSHAILPGVALAFVLAGFSLPLMMLGGVAAGLITVLLAGGVSLVAGLKEDAAMASLFLVAMAAGVMGISLSGNALDLGHVLFGSILAVDRQTLLLVATAGSLVLAVLAVAFRALVVECLDPHFLTQQGRHAGGIQALFLGLVVISLVIGFQALGTLMAAGLMLLPAATARFWSQRLEGMIVIAIGWALVSSLAGLLASYHLSLPAGPSIVLLAGAGYLVSVLVGPKGGWLARWGSQRRREVTP